MSTASNPLAPADLLDREPCTNPPQDCHCAWCLKSRLSHRKALRVIVTPDSWEPQLLAAVFQRGRIVIETFAAGRLMYCWPVNEFQAVAPQEGARVWCLFDPITAEEIMVFSAPTGHEEPVFLGVAEVDFADEEEVVES